MRLKQFSIKILTIGIALVAGLVAGSLTFGFLPTSAKTISDQSVQNSANGPVFKVNKNGQTYGSNLYVTTPWQEPDLILAKGVDGTTGYVKKIDLNKDDPKTPEEAIALQNKRLKDPSPRLIPLYDVDGETIIGQFMIGKPNGVVINNSQGPHLNKK